MPEKLPVIKIEISPKSIFYIFFLSLALWFLYQIKVILIALFISFILMSALSPAVDFLVKQKLPRVLAALLVYLLMICLLTLVVVVAVPPMVAQTGDLIRVLPYLLNRTFSTWGERSAVWERYTQGLINALSVEFARIPGRAVKTTINIAQSILLTLSVIVITFYLLLEQPRFHASFAGLFPLAYQERVKEAVLRIEQKLGSWVRGQVLLGFIVGLASFVGLTILGVGFAIPLAIIAGVLELIPTVGPIISAIPAVIVALTASPALALLVAGLYTLIQQLENNFLVPQVMKKAVGVNPLVTILALMVGGKLFGIIGAVLAVPIVGMVGIISEEVMRAVYDAVD